MNDGLIRVVLDANDPSLRVNELERYQLLVRLDLRLELRPVFSESLVVGAQFEVSDCQVDLQVLHLGKVSSAQFAPVWLVLKVHGHQMFPQHHFGAEAFATLLTKVGPMHSHVTVELILQQKHPLASTVFELWVFKGILYY